MNFNDQFTISTEKRFRMLLLILRLGGIPVCMKKIPKLYYLYSVTSITSMCIVYVGCFLDTFVNVNESKKTMSTIHVWTSLSFLMFIHIMLSIRRSKIEELIFFTESFIWEDLPTRYIETGYLTQAGLIKKIKNIIKWALITLATFHTIQSSIRIITSRQTIFIVWYPFDFYSSPTYEAILISQIFASIVAITVFFSFVLLYSTLVIITCSQLEKLRGKLMAIKWTKVVSQETSLESERNKYNEQSNINQETLHLMLNQLKECVKFHQLILSYMEMLEDNLHLILGGTLLINLFILFLCAFSVIMNWGKFTDMSEGVAGYIIYLVNVYIICVTGTEITKESEKVRDAAWDCNWIGAPIPFQRCVMFMIARSNKTFIFTAAKFVPVSMVTLMNIMQQTMSYFMFLLEMKDSNNLTEDNIPI